MNKEIKKKQWGLFDFLSNNTQIDGTVNPNGLPYPSNKPVRYEGADAWQPTTITETSKINHNEMIFSDRGSSSLSAWNSIHTGVAKPVGSIGDGVGICIKAVGELGIAGSKLIGRSTFGGLIAFLTMLCFLTAAIRVEFFEFILNQMMNL